MKTKYKVKVVDRYNEVDKYNLVVDGDNLPPYSFPVIYTLKYKKNDASLFPEFRGEKVISFEDTGDEVIVKKTNGDSISLDYAEFQELFILMLAENQLHTKATIEIKEDASY